MSNDSRIKEIQCSCVSEFHDAAYGLRVRLHNACSKSANPNRITAWRCVVCGHLKAIL